MAETVRAMFDGETPVRTMDVSQRSGRNYGTVKTHLHRAGKLGLLVQVPRKGLASAGEQMIGPASL